jgi:hypothetical protein
MKKARAFSLRKCRAFSPAIELAWNCAENFFLAAAGCRAGRTAGAILKSGAFRTSRNCDTSSCDTSWAQVLFVFSELRMKKGGAV